MPCGVSKHWIEIEGPKGERRVELDRALTRIGGPGADVELAGVRRGEMQVWNDPPKAVWLGGADGPRLDGAVLEERHLVDGDVIDWNGWRLRFRESAPEAVLEELPREPRARAATPTARAWNRLKAGLLVEQGIADPRTSKRWSDAVVRGEFDADAAARELLAATPIDDADPRLEERSARLLRDFLMTPVHRGVRGASRKVRVAGKRTAAAAVAQFVIVGIILGMAFVGMVLARLKWDTSFDGWIDAILGR